MAVVATAGSTATGSFDDLEAIGRACEERGLWLHVDGAHGASALLSAAHRHRLAGIERASSIAWDPHKMMLMPLTASAVLVRHETDLEAAFSQRRLTCSTRGKGAQLGPGPAQLHLLAPHRRAEGVGGAAAARRRRPRPALRPPVRNAPDAARTGPRAARVRGHSRARVEHLCFRYVGDGARGRRRPRRVEPASCARRTTARATVGSRPRCLVDGGCCA